MTSAFQPPTRSASIHLDAVRGLAAISVMFSHWWNAFYANYDTLVKPGMLLAAAYTYSQFGHAWVIVFFVLSGYLVGGSVLRARANGKWLWRSYLFVRCTRIYVVLVPALLLGGAFDWAGMHQPGAEILYSGHSGFGALYYNVYESLTSAAFMRSLFFLPLWAPGYGSNGPLWSLSHEFWYYVGFPFIVFAFYKGRRLWLRMANALALMTWAVFVGGYKVALFPVWLAGVLILFLPAFGAREPWNRAWVTNLAVTLCMVLMLVGFVIHAREQLFLDHAFTVGRSRWHPPISDLLLSPIVALFIWVILNCATRPLSAAYTWMAQHAAASSYTLYLVHLPALVFLKAYLNLPRVIPTWQTFPLHLGLLFVVFLYAQLIYWIFERNTDRIRRWFKPYVMGHPSAQRKC